LPLPEGLNGEDLVEKILPQKDVDGLHPINAGHLSYRKYELVPCTPKGIIKLLDHYKVRIEGKLAVIINRSDLVGKPLSKLLLDRNATVIMCHSKTPDLKGLSRSATCWLARWEGARTLWSEKKW
jgi:methylenetetrahydrofolate dehydrogenase (NADP+)/methenyltetrahydrofolate cyclohydrolase